MTLLDPASVDLGPAAPACEPTPLAPDGHAVRPGPRPRAIRRSRIERLLERALLAGAASIATIAVLLRFVGPRGLWLDEALTVNIARMPIPALLAALRHDGSPPAYYLLLHYWMRVFGSGTWAVRALAGLLSVVTLPFAWRLGRAIGGRRVGSALVVVMACNPFALRYATESRMYSMVMLLTTVAALALVRAWQRPTIGPLSGLGVACGLLLLTHYWSLYLIGGLAALLAVASAVGSSRRRAGPLLVAVGVGCLLFVPWAPSFAFQARYTGTPWAAGISSRALIGSVREFAGGPGRLGAILFYLYLSDLAVLAVAVGWMWSRARRPARPAGKRPDTTAHVRWAVVSAVLFLVTMMAALLGGTLAGAGFAVRYTSVVLPLFALLVALGLDVLGKSRAGPALAAGALVVIAGLGTVAGAAQILALRTEAPIVAARIAADARPGDVVVDCPDQLGPAVSRLMAGRQLVQVTFPRWDDPSRINWVDYANENASASPGDFARRVVDRAGSHQIWLVWQGGFRTFGTKCENLRQALSAARPNGQELVSSQPRKYYEHESLVRFSR